MNKTIKDAVPIWLPRIAGILAAWLVGWAAKHEFTLDEDQVTTLMIAAYAFLHRAISKRINPSDATKSVLVKEGQATVDAQEAPASLTERKYRPLGE